MQMQMSVECFGFSFLTNPTHTGLLLVLTKYDCDTNYKWPELHSTHIGEARTATLFSTET
jgi:hypothetical protein